MDRVTIAIIMFVLIILLILITHTTDGNILRHYRKMKTPPCSECKYCSTYEALDPNLITTTRVWKCEHPSYMDYFERVNGIKISYESTYKLRGTRFCKFEPKEEK